jgi:hypothetical protein
MKRIFTISEQEKSAILEKYYLLKEVDTRNCSEGDCVDGEGTLVINSKFGNVEVEKTFIGTFKKSILTNGEITINTGVNTTYQSGNFKNGELLTGEGLYIQEVPSENFRQVTKGTFVDGYLTKGTTEVTISSMSFTIKSDNVVKNTYKDAEIKFNDGSIYYGDITDNTSNFEFKSKTKGLETDDLVQFHIKTEGSQSDVERTTSTPTVTPSVSTNSTNTDTKITDELRAKWTGCEYTADDLFRFNKPEDDYVTEIPELGYFKFEGEVDGKNIKVNACFDNFKLIKTQEGNETGDRGEFNGVYYSEDDGLPLKFEGDESKANKFKRGRLLNSPDYDFHVEKFEYIGTFDNGIIHSPKISEGSSVENIFAKSEILFEDNSYYNGNFENGKIKGYGIFTIPSKGKFEGEFEQVKNDNGNTTYKVTLSNGAVIEDLMDYASKVKFSTDKTTDTYLGVLKGAKVNGTVFYQSVYTLKTDDGKKTENTYKGGLMGATVVLKSKSSEIETEGEIIKGKTFETTTDENGKFTFDGVPYGTYDIKIRFGDKLSPYFKYDAENLKIDSNKTYEITTVKTKKLEKREQDYLDQESFSAEDLEDFTEENYKNLILKSLLKSHKDDSTYVEDILDGTFKQKYGKRTALKFCTTQFNNYADELKQVYLKKVSDASIKSAEEIEPSKKVLQYCWNNYKEELSKKIKKDDLSLIQQPGGKLLVYQVDLKENYNRQYIYTKENDMKETIKNIIKEHARIKKIQSSTESKIIENRLNFIFEDSTGYTTRNKIRKNLLSEKNQLLYMGYTPKLVNEIFNRFMVKI